MIQKERELVQRQLHRRHLQMEELEEQLSENSARLRKSEQKVAELREQYHKECDHNKLHDQELKQKRVELVEREMQVKRKQDEYSTVLSIGSEVKVTELKEQILQTRIELTEAERLVQSDRDLQIRLEDENKKFRIANSELKCLLDALHNDLQKLQAIQEGSIAEGETIGTSRKKQDAAHDEVRSVT